MAVLFKHPDLTDYFVDTPDLRIDTPIESIPSIIDTYEAGKVLSFSNLKFDIDHAFWSRLPSDTHPGLKKLKSRVTGGNEPDTALDSGIAAAGLPAGIAEEMKRSIQAIYQQALPIYDRLFAGYEFAERRAVWRLNTILNENLHIDTYREPIQTHFARMFINLDDQPRIWRTSYTMRELFERFAPTLPPDFVRNAEPDALRTAVNKAAYGGATAIWWDLQPRHVAYFNPGDIWIVDSRLISHQIFYGRRAVSIDFPVVTASMRDPGKQYLSYAKRLKDELLADAA